MTTTQLVPKRHESVVDMIADSAANKPHKPITFLPKNNTPKTTTCERDTRDETRREIHHVCVCGVVCGVWVRVRVRVRVRIRVRVRVRV